MPSGTIVTATIVNTGSRAGTYKSSYSTGTSGTGPTSFTSIPAGATRTLTYVINQTIPTGSTVGVFSQYGTTTSYKITYTVELSSGYTDPEDSNNVATYNI